MRVSRSTALVIAVILLTTASTIAGFMVSPGGYLSPLASPPLSAATGGIVGSVSIGNVAPLCKVPATTAPAPPYYDQIGVVITPSPFSDLPLTIPVNWVLVGGCVVEGTFKIGLNPGVYSLTITSCYGINPEIRLPYDPFCANLPRTVTVSSGAWTHVEISITTGIY